LWASLKQAAYTWQAAVRARIHFPALLSLFIVFDIAAHCDWHDIESLIMIFILKWAAYGCTPPMLDRG